MNNYQNTDDEVHKNESLKCTTCDRRVKSFYFVCRNKNNLLVQTPQMLKCMCWGVFSNKSTLREGVKKDPHHYVNLDYITDIILKNNFFHVSCFMKIILTCIT